MRIGIIGAMKAEIEDLHGEMKNPESIEISGLKFFKGDIHGKDVILLECGIGKVSAAVGAALLIDRFKPDYIINTGCAGGFSKELKIGDIVVSEKAVHHDVDATVMGYKYGEIPGMPLFFEADRMLSDLAVNVIKEIGQVNVVKGLIGTGDSFIGDDALSLELRVKFPELEAVEMEGAAIAQTCFIMKVPFVIIRALSDIAGNASKVDYREFMKKASKISAEMVIRILQKIQEK
ncbi:MAG: 5'-methylthioadenosine/adenosylhomocysteine nucleosidase [Spirochaetes bacterium]|nr:5'-methylthioadenosine/adenosylhomocysteine nucleosidase [Spirochaetota bacterium]